MKEIYFQNYLIENYTLIAIIIGTYFVISMKSAIDKSIKKLIFIAMTLLLILSMTEFYINFLKDQAMLGNSLIIVGIIYYSLKPLVMVVLINMVDHKKKLIYVPAIINFLFYCNAFLKDKIFYLGVDGSIQLGLWGYAFIVTNWIYWGFFLFVLNFKFHSNVTTEIKHLQTFFGITCLMTANILESMGIRAGLLNEIYAIAFLFYYLTVHVRISQRVSEEKELKLKEQRMSLMLSQIQPHFLYNTLNTITALCRVNPKLAETTTIKFSMYLRENMYNMGKNEIQLFSKELEHTNIYLDIEKLRFGDRINVEYDIMSDDFNMPTLTLQPIVENAVKHGICKKLEGGTIKISTEKKGKDYIITVSDNGIGFEIEKILSDGNLHVGIHNVKERLKNIIKAELEIISFIGIGTIVKIIIPGERKNIRLESGKRREIFSIGR